MKNSPSRYDSTSVLSIFEYSKELLGKSLFEAVAMFSPNVSKTQLKIKGKGGLGQMVEKFYYGYTPNNKAEADFAMAQLELKTTPLKKTRTGFAIKERLVCDVIDFCAIVDVDFEHSPFYKKSLLMLILFYLHQNGVEKYDLEFIYSVLWKLKGKDLQIIKHDYEVIVEKIRQGKAHELSEGDTMYLGACRKGQKGEALRKQPFNEIGAPKRAFALKTAYMRTILRYVESTGKNMVSNIKLTAPLFQLVTEEQLKYKSFEQIITERLMVYRGYDYKQIARAFDVCILPTEKSKYDHATRTILYKGINKIENTEEIAKAGIIVKNIRLRKTGNIKESMSFKNIDYQEVCDNADFYQSEWYDLITSRFMFIVYKETDIPIKEKSLWVNESERYVLDKVVFWTMPEGDMELAESFWKNIRENVLADNYYTEQDNTYWRLADHRNFHVRPKGKNRMDVQFSPLSGRCVPKVCYWFNSEYVKAIIQSNQNI